MNIIDDFLSNFNKKNTIRNYRRALKDYFTVLNVEDPNAYFRADREYKTDVKKFCNSLSDKAPKTFVFKIAAVKSFFEENEAAFPKKEVKKFRMRNNMTRISPITIDKVFSKSELKKILSHGGLREKALFLTLVSSGMRISETLQLKPNDIDFDNDPPMIKIKKEYTKTKEKRVTFISYEAAEYLQQWLKVKDDYLEKYSHCIQNIDKDIYKEKKDDRVFPFTANGGAWKMLHKMLKNSGYDDKVEDLENVERYEFHLHSFRKFFRTNLAVEMPVDMIEALMGHSGYLTDSYRRYQDNPSLMFEPYKKSVHMVTIFEVPPDLTGIHEQLTEKDKEIEELRHQMETMRDQMNILMAGKLIEMDKKKS